MKTLLTCLLSLAATAGFGLATAEQNGEIPIQAWIHDPVIASPDVSPDGNHIVALTLTAIDKAPDITVWDTRSLSKAPIRFAPKHVKALKVYWLSNDQLFVLGRQKFDYRFGGRPTRWFRDRIYIVDYRGKRFREILDDDEIIGGGLISLLPEDPKHVMIKATNLEYATDIYELDLETFLTRRIQRGSPRAGFLTNYKGEVVGTKQVVGSGVDTRIEYRYRNPNTGEMELHHALYAIKRAGLSPLAFDKDGHTIYMADNRETDKAVLRRYDLLTRQLSEPIFDGDFEVVGVHLGDKPHNWGEVVSYVGYGPKRVEKYVDGETAALHERLSSALPAGESQSVVGMSDDRTIMIIESYSDREAGAYYLMVNGEQLIPLGRQFPNLKPEQMAPMQFVTYAARDGLEIPAYLTLPVSGKKPYPAVIMPHGGPWARDYWGFDKWVQFLANRGYAVLQPQYRGSEGWGKELWRAGDNEWGQKMQDDKDDGAAWLVEQGIAEKDRIAIYGYSYGGYAAMAAAVRPDSPYQCAIAGAGLSELDTFDKITFEGKWGRVFQNPTISGLSPLEHVEDANIPIYIFHGDRDQRVPVEQSRKLYDALKNAEKTVEYNEIPDLWHSLPWWPTHHYNVLTSIEDFLANRCGPGGL